MKMKKFNWLFVVLLVASIVLGSISLASAGTVNNAKANGGEKRVEQVYRELHARIEMGEKLGILGKEIADFLGIKVADLIKDRHSGKSLAAIATEKGKSEQDLVNFVFSLYKPRLDELLSKGKITQEQYNNITVKLQDVITKMVKRVPKSKNP
jgi:uncharacterized membrane protein